MSFHTSPQTMPFNQEPVSKAITIVSGLPRSGTSMMMSMLAAGGLPVVTDSQRQADDSNPKGYFELERVKKLKEGDFDWLKDSQGKAVKIISALLEYLPPQYTYRIIFMRREMPEILASQREMLLKRGEAADRVSDAVLGDLYQRHLVKVEQWLKAQPNMGVIYVRYNTLLKEPEEPIEAINRFMGGHLNALAMRQVIDGRLYRQRNG